MLSISQVKKSLYSSMEFIRSCVSLDGILLESIRLEVLALLYLKPWRSYSTECLGVDLFGLGVPFVIGLGQELLNSLQGVEGGVREMIESGYFKPVIHLCVLVIKKLHLFLGTQGLVGDECLLIQRKSDFI